jgi:hypothetical protein
MTISSYTLASLELSIHCMMCPDIHEEDAPVIPDPQEHTEVVVYDDRSERVELVPERIITEAWVVSLFSEKSDCFLREELVSGRVR